MTDWCDEIWIDKNDGSRELWQRFIVDPRYTPAESSYLRARWGSRIGETMCGLTEVRVFPDYIDTMRTLDQSTFTEWYLWKFPIPQHPSSQALAPVEATQLELL